MDYSYKNGNIILNGLNSFQIDEILECGQCFRFNKLGDKEYIVIAFDKVLHIKQEKNKITLSPCTPEEFETIWQNYFDLSRNYLEIKELLCEKDETLRSAVEFAGGIRILNQDFWECLVSFIVSQNQNIPRIKQILINISQLYGYEIRDHYYTFPSAQTLKNTTLDEINRCKAGFRGKYILDAAKKVAGGELILDSFSSLSTEELRKSLMRIYGVGNKVADCVMLFSCRREEVFPTDVWVKRVMQHYYFDNKEVHIREIHALAEEKWGALAGFAQQYLFHYARQQKIAAK